MSFQVRSPGTGQPDFITKSLPTEQPACRLHPTGAGFTYKSLDEGSDIRWNALYTSNIALRDFLNSKQSGGDWQSTQTVEPLNLAAGSPSDTSVPLTWNAIQYTGDAGGYEVVFATDFAGPYTLFETTVSKSVTNSLVTGLFAGTQYFFRVRLSMVRVLAAEDRVSKSGPES